MDISFDVNNFVHTNLTTVRNKFDELKHKTTKLEKEL